MRTCCDRFREGKHQQLFVVGGMSCFTFAKLWMFFFHFVDAAVDGADANMWHEVLKVSHPPKKTAPIGMFVREKQLSKWFFFFGGGKTQHIEISCEWPTGRNKQGTGHSNCKLWFSVAVVVFSCRMQWIVHVSLCKRCLVTTRGGLPAKR